jgi:serine/threonine protein kinase
MKKPNLSIDVSIANAQADQQTDMETTYRAEGLSIGRDCLRFQGKEVSSSPSLDQYIIDGTIGRGTSSVVQRARLKREPNKYYALKVFPLNIQANQDIYEPGNDVAKKKHSAMLVQEIKLMCQLECECLVQMVGAFYDPGVNVTMVLEYMDYGSLDHYMNFNDGFYEGRKEEPRMLPQSALAAISFQILFGLAYLHHEDILHRDIKPANILINSEGSIKISDLGISGLVSSAKTGLDATSSGLNHTVVGTSRYMSPERVLDKAYGPPCDIWSFGLILIECATGGWSPLCSESSNDRGLRSIIDLAMILDDFCIDDVLARLSKQQSKKPSKINRKINWRKEANESGGLSEVLKWSLQRLPETRIPALVLLDSPWFRRYKIEDVQTAQKVMRRYFTEPSTSAVCDIVKLDKI